MTFKKILSILYIYINHVQNYFERKIWCGNDEKIIFSNKTDKKDQIYLINKLKKYPDGIFEVKYKNDIFGRLKTSTDNKHFIPHYMLDTPKNIRCISADKYYHDLDIKNCHPVLIYQIAKKTDILLTELKNILMMEKQFYRTFQKYGKYQKMMVKN